MSLVEYTNVVKAFKDTIAVNDVSFKIESGRTIGLLGPNGSGKTTLMKMTAGLISPDSGTITIDGLQIGEKTKAIVSYLPERTYLDESMTVNEAVNYFADFYLDFDKTKAKEMLKSLSINPNGRIKTFSKGTKEKVQLIIVMSRKAKLYLLDEPISGVDPAARDYILNNIIKEYREDATVVLSTHLIQDVEPMLDDAVIVRYGKLLLSSSVEEMKEKYRKSIDEYFREAFKC